MPSSCNDTMYSLGTSGSSIRALYAYGQQRKAEIGADKVFDFSLGNPSVPAPEAVKRAIIDALDHEPPVLLHGYTASAGTDGARAAIATSLNRRFGTSYSADNLFISSGASAAIVTVLKAVLDAGDEVICITPFFPEYQVWIESVGAVCVHSPADADMMPDLADIKSRISSRTRMVIVNSPNNPTGAIYPAEQLRELGVLLGNASKDNGRSIYLLADEPYREIVYGTTEVPWVPDLYDNTIVCYSYSKSLSLPGGRIGYVLVPDSLPDWREVMAAVAGAGRVLGHVCAPSLVQKIIEICVDEPTNVDAYAANRRALTQGLERIGYSFIEPQGAFYLWMKALEPDAQAFSDRARAHELLIVPSEAFGTPGYVRIGYCVDRATIENSMPAFEALYREYQDRR